ncbi:MAG: class I SAM-dependent methyltransferase [Spirochaetes bacterium]|nr:class I SAM-dependent methyltransferase [Spirochaetota bacterium]
MENPEPYSSIAQAYDYILRHVDYTKWYEYIKEIMHIYCNDPVDILELGCGTGKFGAKFSADNYKIFGIDISLPMLMVAKTRAFKNFKIACCDIRNFYFKKKFDFIFCVHDTLNYLMEDAEIRQVFKSVKEVMHKNSIFMFDLTTEYNIERFFENRTTFYKTGSLHIEWNNHYDKINKIITSAFKTSKPDGTIEYETHKQKIYSEEEIKKLLLEEGFNLLAIYSDYTFEPPSETSVMMNFIVEKKS